MDEEDIIEGEFEPTTEWETAEIPPPQLEDIEPVQIKAQGIRYDRKFNMGNFESLHPTITIWVRTRLPEVATFDLDDCKRRVREMARENVRAQLLHAKASLEIPFLGLHPPANHAPDPIYVSTVSVGLCYKANLGHYESITPAYTDWADLRQLGSSQAELHLALYRMWMCLWANIHNEIDRAKGVEVDPNAFFGLPEIEIEDLTEMKG